MTPPSPGTELLADRTDTEAVTERIVRNGAVEIAVYEQGNRDGETILLLHGWPDTHHLWDAVAPLLRDRFHLVAVDNRGHGGSGNPRGFRAFRLSELAEDHRAVIDAVSPDRPVHVLAHDWGSVAMWEAVCEPGAEHRIASFTSVSGPNLDHLSRWARRLLSRPTPRNVALVAGQLASIGYTFLFMIPVLPKALLALTMSEQRWRAGLAMAERADPEQISLGPTFTKDVGRGLRVYRANVLPALLRPRERTTRVPVQVIVGTRDPAIRRSCYDNELDWAGRVWRRVVDGGHWLPFSHPALLATSTVELVDAVTGGEPARALRRAELHRAEQGRRRKQFGDQLLVITGGGSGIGRQTALAFAGQGAEVVVSDVNLASAEETAALITAAGGAAHAYRLDVADERAVRAHADEVAATHGVPDVLINNAGVGQVGRFFDTPAAEFARVLDINLYGVINGSRAFGAKMAARGLGGHIVNLASMAAYSPQQGFSAYSTSKSAVFMFSDCLRAELAGAGIGVSTICPGIVHTNIVANTAFAGLSKQDEAAEQQRYDQLYRRRRYGPDKVATRIVSAVRKNRQIVPVTPESWLQYHLNRFVPALVRFIAARVNLTGSA